MATRKPASKKRSTAPATKRTTASRKRAPAKNDAPRFEIPAHL